MNIFTKIYRTAWIVLIFLIIFLERNNLYWVVGTIILLLLLSGIAVLRFLDSRNEWRKIIQEESLDKDIP
jgi:ABC-type bacteriocin/lantibiotic exporter with double-glycine peptidase domain